VTEENQVKNLITVESTRYRIFEWRCTNLNDIYRQVRESQYIVLRRMHLILSAVERHTYSTVAIISLYSSIRLVFDFH